MSAQLITTFTTGLLLMWSLIIPIGAQNAFVLKQGLRRQHLGIVCLFCALSDAILTVTGIYGLYLITNAIPGIIDLVRYAGAAFLCVYGAISFKRAIYAKQAMIASTELPSSLAKTITACLVFTWLNPHVYLDTVFIIGSVAAQYQDKTMFALGAITGSFSFFFALGYTARLCAPMFRSPGAWRVIDLLVGCIMWAVVWKLVA